VESALESPESQGVFQTVNLVDENRIVVFADFRTLDENAGVNQGFETFERAAFEFPLAVIQGAASADDIGLSVDDDALDSAGGLLDKTSWTESERRHHDGRRCSAVDCAGLQIDVRRLKQNSLLRKDDGAGVKSVFQLANVLRDVDSRQNDLVEVGKVVS